MITNNFRKRLQVTASEEITRTHLKRRTNWTDLIFDLVDWEHLELAMENAYSTSKTGFARIIKFQHDIQNTGRQKKKFTQN